MPEKLVRHHTDSNGVLSKHCLGNSGGRPRTWGPPAELAQLAAFSQVSTAAAVSQQVGRP